MVLKLRLARPGTPGGSKRHAPRYNIVLAHARTARDAKPLEVLGTYNPIPQLPQDAPAGARKQKEIKIDVNRARYWLGVGAQPSDTVWRLLSMIGLLEPRYLPTGPQTAEALKSVRFPTHTEVAEKKRKEQQEVEARDRAMAALKDRFNASMLETGAGTTSPMDPNAASTPGGSIRYYAGRNKFLNKG